MVAVRRKFDELYASHKSQIAEEALKLFGVLYDVERQVQELDIDARRAARQQLGRLAADTLHAWLLAQRQRVADGSAMAKAINQLQPGTLAPTDSLPGVTAGVILALPHFM